MGSSTNKGLHLLGDLFGCDLSGFVPQEKALAELKGRVSKRIADCALVELGSFYHYFGPHAVTATICLAESHINFHTWPEDRIVNTDLFICNFTQDNTAAANALFDFLAKELFFATEIVKREIYR